MTETCKRCGGRTPTLDNIADTSFWGWLTTEVETTVERRVHLLSHYFRRNPKHGSSNLVSDERWAMCSECWSLLIGRFFQGRSISAMPGKEGQ